MSKIKKYWIPAVFLLCTSGGAAMAMINNNPVIEGAGYSCDSTTNKCTCTGAADCYTMGQGHDCNTFGGHSIRCNSDDTSCTCDWWMH